MFGALKSEARRTFREWAADNPELTVKRIMAAHTRCVAGNQLSQETLASAWNIHQTDEDVWENV
jgi:hypothetical protein